MLTKTTKKKIKWFADFLFSFANIDKYCTTKGCYEFAGKQGQHMLVENENTKRKFPLCEECYEAHCLYLESKECQQIHRSKRTKKSYS